MIDKVNANDILNLLLVQFKHNLFANKHNYQSTIHT